MPETQSCGPLSPGGVPSGKVGGVILETLGVRAGPEIPVLLFACKLVRTSPPAHRGKHAKSHQSCPTLCDFIDCSPSGSSVHGFLQARMLRWVAMSSFRGSS